MITHKHIGRVRQLNSKFEGFATIVAVIILSLVAVLIIVTGLALNTESAKASVEWRDARQAESMANSCMEVAINKLKGNLSYVGSETLAIDDYSCDIGTVTESGGIYTINSTGYAGDSVYKIQVTLSEVIPNTQIDSWERI